MKILVTGGAGYLGSVLVPMLLKAQHVVTVLDNFAHGVPSLVSCVDRRYDLDLIKTDCRDARLVAPLVRTADVIIPLAAIVGAPACDRDHTAARSINLEAVRLIAGLAADSGQLLIYPNTNSGYGTTPEGQETTEESPMSPLSLYGVTKMRAEDAVMQHGNSIALRLATVFGASPRMRLDLMVNNFTFRAVTEKSLVLFSPHARRNFIHVADVARVFMHCLDRFTEMRGRVYNAGDTRANVTKLGLCEAIKSRVPDLVWFEGEGSDPDKRDYLVSNARLEATGWRPVYTLDDGIAEVVKMSPMLQQARFGNA